VLPWLARCADPLPDHAASRAPSAAAVPAVVWPQVAFDPPAAAGGAARTARIRVSHESPLGATAAVLVSGTITTAQLRGLSSGTISETLSKRLVRSVAWIDGHDPRLLSVAPLVPLTAGSTYTVAVADPEGRAEFSVDPAAPSPMLQRVWPPGDDAEASRSLAVWCLAPGGDRADFASVDERIALEPWGREGRIAGGLAPGCLVWAAVAPTVDGSFDLPPPVIGASGTDYAIDPAPIAGSGTAPLVAPETCVASEVAFGPGCALALDDRLVVRTPSDRTLWAIDAGQPPIVRVSTGGARFVVRLTGDADPVPVRLTTIDRQAAIATADLAVRRGPPQNHLVVSEVYANPLGAEPAQEWVEIFNDGTGGVSLGGWSLRDGGGSAVLPDTILAPGAYALVVNEQFAVDDGVDPAVAQGTAIVRVDSLGLSGLSNEGEAISLFDPAGVLVSRFAAIKPKSGVSAVRLAPDALDEDPASFSLCPAGSATPGGPN
jgi:hypothetical protein